MVMAQSPESAKYRGMPESAIASGLVDYVLTPAEMPLRLIAYARGLYVAPLERSDSTDGSLPEQMQKMIVLLRSRTGHDFSAYKPSTIRRRIERRMNLHQLNRPDQYVKFLHENPHELDLLFKELLIGVTAFFRDPEAYEALGKTVLPELFKSRPEDGTLRVWVPGCSTGEEAYSLAIVLQECADRLKRRLALQLFATDLDTEAIEAARAGQYPDGIAVDVSPERLKRFFTREEGSYQICKELREKLIFAPQSVTKDPPFTKLDLISCRNLLIYLQADMQKHLLSLFHYALRPGGALFLGPSESIGEPADHFLLRDKRWKIFSRRESPGTFQPPTGVAARAAAAATPAPHSAPATERPREAPSAGMFERMLLKRFTPACVVINERGDINYVQGRTGEYLEPAQGQARLNILEMAREGLRVVLLSAMRRILVKEEEIFQERVRVRTNGSFTMVAVTVSSITESEALRGLMLVTFRPCPEVAVSSRKIAATRVPRREASRLRAVERELQFTRESLQSTVEELEAANEELKSANEELQSTNEELQSANEELETSKEEMQSLNEELQTVNGQLQAKVEALSEASDDMQNLLNSTAIATIFLDNDLKIKRFTEETRKLIRLIPSDIGRPIGDLASNLRYQALAADAREVLHSLKPREKELRTRDGSWRNMRITPYRTTNNVIDGLVLTFVDINRVKLAERLANAAQTYAENIVDTVREPLLILDKDLRVVSANRSYYRMFHTRPAQVEKLLFSEINGGAWKDADLRKEMHLILTRKKSLNDFRIQGDFAGLGTRAFLLNARHVQQDTTMPGLVLVALEPAQPARERVR